MEIDLPSTTILQWIQHNQPLIIYPRPPTYFDNIQKFKDAQFQHTQLKTKFQNNQKQTDQYDYKCLYKHLPTKVDPDIINNLKTNIEQSNAKLNDFKKQLIPNIFEHKPKSNSTIEEELQAIKDYHQLLIRQEDIQKNIISLNEKIRIDTNRLQMFEAQQQEYNSYCYKRNNQHDDFFLWEYFLELNLWMLQIEAEEDIVAKGELAKEMLNIINPNKWQWEKSRIMKNALDSYNIYVVQNQLQKEYNKRQNGTGWELKDTFVKVQDVHYEGAKYYAYQVCGDCMGGGRGGYDCACGLKQRELNYYALFDIIRNGRINYKTFWDENKKEVQVQIVNDEDFEWSKRQSNSISIPVVITMQTLYCKL